MKSLDRHLREPRTDTCCRWQCRDPGRADLAYRPWEDKTILLDVGHWAGSQNLMDMIDAVMGTLRDRGPWKKEKRKGRRKGGGEGEGEGRKEEGRERRRRRRGRGKERGEREV